MFKLQETMQLSDKGYSEDVYKRQELNYGTGELNSETSGMDTEIQNKIDEILSSIGGEETETKSFVSEKNTDVDSVQFVIKTSGIEKKETVEKEVETETTSFWQKLIQLF